MLWVKLPVVNRIQPQSYKSATGVENKATGYLNLNDSTDMYYYSIFFQLLKLDFSFCVLHESWIWMHFVFFPRDQVDMS